MTLIVASALCALGLVLGSWFVYYGAAAGLVRREILASYRGRYDRGRPAFVRGVFYVAVGASMVVAALVAGAGVVCQVKQRIESARPAHRSDVSGEVQRDARHGGDPARQPHGRLLS